MKQAGLKWRQLQSLQENSMISNLYQAIAQFGCGLAGIA